MQLVVRKGVVRARGVTIAVGERVVPHVLVAKSPGLEDGTGRALELYAHPTAVEKAVVVRVVRITADEVGPRACTIEADDVCQRWLEEQGLVR